VSHTPVREALITLAGIGVIDLLPNRGAIVRAMTARDVREVFQVRRALECEAVRSGCGRIAKRDLDLLAAELRKFSSAASRPSARLIAKARELDSRLHDLVTRSCGNKLLANEIGRLTILFRAFRDVAWEHDQARRDYRRLAEEAGEHLAIVEALSSGDRRAATRAMSRHIRSGMKYWTRALTAQTE
jgi:DNA-binding GntR family transcriptional regulator